MRRSTLAVRSLIQLVRHHYYIAGIAGAILLAGVSGGLILTGHSDTPKNASTTVHTTGSTSKKEVKGATTAQTAAQSNPTPTTSTAAKSSAAPKAPAPATQHKLVISPSSFSMAAGSAYNGITIHADDNRAINMPMISSGSGNFFTAFPAGPAKATWSGGFSSMKTLSAGTYTIQVMGQADRTTFYYGTVTITVTGAPHITLSVQQTGYDSGNDRMVFSVHVNRLYGATAPIETWYASDIKHTLECPIYDNGSDNYTMYCSVIAGAARPATGTIQMNMGTRDGSTFASADVPFNLPAHP